MIHAGLPDEFVIFDTEFTSWEGSMARGWSCEGEYRELVQIGAVSVRNLNEIDSFLVYVRPQRNRYLSSYFIELTGITQKDVDEKGILFKEALQKFLSWSAKLPLYSYGNDADVLIENELLYNLSPRSVDLTQTFDVCKVFEEGGIDTQNYMSSSIPRAFNHPILPKAHDALNDARSILLGLRLLYQVE